MNNNDQNQIDNINNLNYGQNNYNFDDNNSIVDVDANNIDDSILDGEENEMNQNQMDPNMMYQNQMDPNMMYQNQMDPNMQMNQNQMDPNMMQQNMQMDQNQMDPNMMQQNMQMGENQMNQNQMDPNMMQMNMQNQNQMQQNLQVEEEKKRREKEEEEEKRKAFIAQEAKIQREKEDIAMKQQQFEFEKNAFEQMKEEQQERMANGQGNGQNKPEDPNEIKPTKRVRTKLEDRLIRQAEFTYYKRTHRVPKGGNEAYKNLQKDLAALEDYMEEIEGRTNLTQEEMDKYDKLSLQVYDASRKYLQEKNEEYGLEASAGERAAMNAKKPDKEESARIDFVKDLAASVHLMRKEMFEDQLKEKVESLNALASEGVAASQRDRDALLGADLSDNDKRVQLEDTVVRSLFYDARIGQAASKNELELKEGESFDKALIRLDSLLDPKPVELDGIRNDPLTQTIVDKGVQMNESGLSMTVDDINHEKNVILVQKGREIEHERNRQNNMAKHEPARQNNLERQLEGPQPNNISTVHAPGF
ncbi:MAG: hypothetical protein K6G11_05185 [Lachnospiraceae bacterium]|nr:hypothetical protein [Lachnospiraceae bacterium]